MMSLCETTWSRSASAQHHKASATRRAYSRSLVPLFSGALIAFWCFLALGVVSRGRSKALPQEFSGGSLDAAASLAYLAGLLYAVGVGGGVWLATVLPPRPT